MKIRKLLASGLFSLSLCMVAQPKPANAIICELWDLLNALVTPLPTVDSGTDLSSLFANLQQVLQTVESVSEVMEYENKLTKLSEGGSVASSLNQVQVPALENTTKGSETSVDAYKGTVPGVQVPGVNFEQNNQTEQAVMKTAVVANPVGEAETIAAEERKNAFIQQARIDLLSDLLVAKKKLAELKQSDSQAQGASSSSDTVGGNDVSITMKDFENQVQALEQKIVAMRNLREGIAALKTADTVQEDINVGGSGS